MLRYIVFFLLAGWLPLITRAQFTNSGAQIIVSGANLVLDNLDLVNSGTFTHTAGIVRFTGNSNAAVAGTIPPQFFAIELNKPGAQIQLQTGINVNDQILFSNGLLDLNNNNIILGTTGYLNGEKESSRITGVTGGYVEFTSLLNAPAAANPGNLGLVISSPANLGSTVIRRGHVSQSNGANMANSIFRYYDVLPTNNTSLQATIGINYFDAELNTLGETMLTVWKSPNTTTWTSLGYNTRNAATNFVDQLNITDMARFTLSSELYVLPLSISELHTRCINNQVVISWQTRGAADLNKFIIDRSANGADWQPIGTVPVTGKSTYAYTDAQSFNGAWYRIIQVDEKGQQFISPMVQSKCDGNEEARVFPNPAYGNSWLQLQAASSSKVVMRLFDHKGTLVKILTANAAAGVNQFDLQINNLPQGVYSLVVNWDGQVKTIKVVKL
ncbi:MULTISPECIES: T9SS type A sorting domain-containing protein [Niastella]|uniref:T9SS type A sorting domain-containing protein n=1 Tax=Niastella soli TaxID=2821487 RepID=A0ABS3YU00_9BACT|nr:T9SS type A sorting domain-containing protein [Niastella soli]MBO9201396.1 T9SS type A sorting domain-containing protein [Niastella soli]